MRGDVIFEVAAGHQPTAVSNVVHDGDITERAQKLIAACKLRFSAKGRST